MAIDSNNRPHVAWHDESGGTNAEALNYLKFNGTAWVDADGSGRESMTVPKSFYYFYVDRTNLALDELNNPHFLWNSYCDLAYIYWNGSGWVDYFGITNADFCVYGHASCADSYTSMVLDKNGDVHMAWDYKDPPVASQKDVFYAMLPKPTPTVTLTVTSTATATCTATATATVTMTFTITQTMTITPTATNTPVPLILTLKGSYPNPLRTACNIMYHLTVDADVDVKIYTVSGEVVLYRKGISGQAGNNTFYWDLNNNDSASTASGVYLYSVSAYNEKNPRQTLMSKLAFVK
jgi:hypothetical protein